MKHARIIWALTVILMLTALPALGEGELISAETTLQRMEENPILNLFDLRSMENYDAGHLPNAVNFPLETLEADIQRILDNGFSYMEAEIIVYGDSAEDGWEAVKILNGLGFANTFNLGTLDGWPGKLMTTEEEILESRRLLGNLDTVDIYGNKVDENLLKGYKLTMVNVWATFCGPCISEMPELARLSQDWQEKGVQIIGLLSDVTDYALQPVADRVASAKSIAENAGADYPHLLPSAAINQKVLSQVDAVPTTFFVDETGMLVGYAYSGARDYDAWNRIIEETLKLLP